TLPFLPPPPKIQTMGLATARHREWDHVVESLRSPIEASGSAIFSSEKSAERRKPTLFKNILVPTDGSDLAAKAVEQGVLFAKEIGAKITAVTVTEPFPPHLGSVAPSELEYAPIEYMRHAEAYAETVLGTVSAAANPAGVACEVLHVEHGHIYQAIIDAAEARKCDLIVMASHRRRGVSAVVLGSERVKVLTHSRIPVLVYRRGVFGRLFPPSAPIL